MRFINILLAVIMLVFLAGCIDSNNNVLPPDGTKPPITDKIVYSMKGVGIDLPHSDFTEMKNAGIEILSTEWGMEEDISDVLHFLDQAQAAGLKVVMDGGFSYTAWGFTDNDWDHLPKGKRPVWQKERVQNWIKALKQHPAIYAWDICNEFGENLPSGADMENSDWPKSRITIEQLKQAKTDVLEVDSTRPIHVRTYEWDCDNTPSYIETLLHNKIADIISLNIYSNYLENGKLQWPEIVEEAGPCCVEAIKKQSPGTLIWISLAAFEDGTLFSRPMPADLERDIKSSLKIDGIDGLSFFGWGPVNQWDEVNDWYLPQTGADLWQVIKKSI